MRSRWFLLWEPIGFTLRTAAPDDMNSTGFEGVIVQCQADAERGWSAGVVMDQNIAHYQALNRGLFWFVLVYSGLFCRLFLARKPVIRGSWPLVNRPDL